MTVSSLARLARTFSAVWPKTMVRTFREIKLPRKIPKEHISLTHPQAHDLANASGDRAPTLLLLCYTGLRSADMVGRRGERHRLRTAAHPRLRERGRGRRGHRSRRPKSHKRRTFPFPHLLAPALRPLVDGKSPDDLVVADKPGM